MLRPIEVEIALEKGALLQGHGWGDFSEIRGGEFVFSTALSGIQESLTDPSFARQVVVSTAAHLGNTGVNRQDSESGRVWAEGLVCRHLSLEPSNWRSKLSLSDWLFEEKRFVVDGIDTRALAIHLRDHGSQRGVVYRKSSMSKDEAISAAKELPPMAGRELASEVTCASPYEFSSDVDGIWPQAPLLGASEEQELPIAVVDYGIKTNILRILQAEGFRCTVFPATTKAEDLLSAGFKGVFLSNGPGDPSSMGYAVEELKKLLGKLPVMGICMGHQLLSRALGAKTYRLPFGHRGIHHPVVELNDKGESMRTWITSQNHGFAVDADNLPPEVSLSFVHADDGSVEGISSAERKCFSVQFHPEAAPGPVDPVSLFVRFREMIDAS